MSNAPKILCVSGSLRKASFNSILARIATKEAISLGAEAEFIDLNDYDIPLFNEDLEKLGTPESVIILKDKLVAAGGLIICNPEYNGSVSSPMKNYIDWMSRPTADGKRGFQGTNIALMGTSPGALGGLRALSHLRDIFTSVGSLVVAKQAAFGAAYDLYKDGAMTDEGKMDMLKSVVSNLIDVTNKLK